MTRSVPEALDAVAHGNPQLVWGAGVHPGDRNALATFDPGHFGHLVDRVAVVGEIGLHRWSGDLDRQREVLRAVLASCVGQPVLLSVHSAGAPDETLDLLLERPHAGSVLHWFTGDASAVERAVQAGFFFSISGAVEDDRLMVLPRERLLPETDFPTGGKGAGRRPGDTSDLERRLGFLWGASTADVRRQFYRNLRDVASASGAVERLPERLQDFLLVV
jgi:TatD DNase family protein